jgi:methylenetetrahydrofolate reductase (NADPH)
MLKLLSWIPTLSKVKMKISYEFYPPKDLNYQKVVEEYSLLSNFGPRFISITYGALGSSQEKSVGLVKAFKASVDVEVVAHLTLVGKSKQEVSFIVDEFSAMGVTKIVALRGDVAEGSFIVNQDGFQNTAEFVDFLVKKKMEVFVSAYPEPHPDSEGFEFDVKLLKEKTLAGATQSISQFCFSMHEYQKLVDAIKDQNIQNDLTAGIMPIYNITSLCSMAERCGTKVPSEIISQFSDDPQKNEQASIKICIKQLEDLQAMGINNFHFYTLNQSSLLKKIFIEMGLQQ